MGMSHDDKFQKPKTQHRLPPSRFDLVNIQVLEQRGQPTTDRLGSEIADRRLEVTICLLEKRKMIQVFLPMVQRIELVIK